MTGTRHPDVAEVGVWVVNFQAMRPGHDLEFSGQSQTWRGASGFFFAISKQLEASKSPFAFGNLPIMILLTCRSVERLVFLLFRGL